MIPTVDDRSGAQVAIGDIFQIPLDPGQFGYGQLVGKHPALGLYVAVFSTLHDVGEPISPAETIASDVPVLLAHTQDALIWHGRWPVVGRSAVEPGSWPRPRFKMHVGGPESPLHLFDYELERGRPATREELERALTPGSVAPIGLQKAFRALHGKGDWAPYYEGLRFETVQRAAEIDL